MTIVVNNPLPTPVSIANGGTGQATAPLGINALITGTTQDTAPDPAADFVGTADISASTGKKVLLGDFPIRQYWGCQGTVVGGSTVYLGVVARTNESDAWCTMPFAGTITKLYVNVDAAPGVGNQVAFTMRKNGVDQTITCTISGGAATTANDTAHSFTFAAGDTISCKEVPSAAITSTRCVANWEIVMKRND